MAGKVFKIAKRVQGGWTERQVNLSRDNCDDCGAQLWVAPDGQTIYCNDAAPEHTSGKAQ